MDDKLKALQECDLFAGLKKKHLEALARITDRVSVPAERVLIHEGQVTTHMYIIIDGAASVRVGDNVVAQLGAGAVIGELSMIDDKVAAATVTASEASTVWLIARAGFAPVWDKNPEMSTSMLRAVVARLRSADELLHN